MAESLAVKYRPQTLSEMVAQTSIVKILTRQLEREEYKNAFIKVDDYDQEWYDNGELLDLSINDEHQFGFALTYNSPARVTDVLVTLNQGSGVSDKEKYN